MIYRSLNNNEIDILEKNNCWAENWTNVKVANEKKRRGKKSE